MTKTRSTKSALISSVLALLLCCSMLLGTTFAWFTDSVTSANNIIQSGNLDIELKYAKIDNGAITEWDTVQGKDNIFDKNALWEPGRVEVVYLEVSNLGTLALKYQLGVNVVNEIAGTNVAGETFKLSDHLVFKVVDLAEKPTAAYTREEAMATAGAEKGLKDYNGTTTPLEVGGTDYVALIVYMPESVGNEANYRGDDIPTIELGINLLATQLTSEEDSFDNQYDAEASMGVSTATELQVAIDAGEDVTLLEDIVLDSPIVIPAPAVAAYSSAVDAIVINLNGKAITLPDDIASTTYAIKNLGNLVLMDSVGGGSVNARGIYNGYDGATTYPAATITVMNGTYNALGTDGGAAIFNYGTANIKGGTFTSIGGYSLNNRSTMTIDDAVVTGGIYNMGALDINGGIIKTVRGGYTHAVYSNGGSLTVDNGTFSGNGNEVINANSDVATINGGTFQKVEKTSYLMAGSKMVINGGTFLAHESNPAGHPVRSDVTVKGGTFNYEHTNIADGYLILKNADKTYTVVKGSKVATEAELREVLANGGSAKLTADISATEILTAVADGTVIDGNGHTLTSTAGRAINVDCAGEVTIKNLTISGGDGCERGINIINKAGVVNVEGVTITGDDLIIAVNAYLAPGATAAPVVNIKDCTLTTNMYTVQAYADGAVFNIEDSKITGWCALIVCEDNVKYNVKNSELVGINTYADAEGQENAYSTIAINEDLTGIEINVEGGSITAQSNEGCETQFIIGHNGTVDVKANLDAELKLVGVNTDYLNVKDGCEVTVRSEYAD